MSKLLEGETVVITGGASGIGRAIVLEFARHGATVVVPDVDETPREGGLPTHERIAEETASGATFVDCDVTDVDDLTAAVDAVDDYGGVTTMVNNAGLFRTERFLDVTPEEYEELMAVNTFGPFFGAQAAAQKMVNRDSGCIINVSSINGLVGHGGYVTYCASKGAVTSLTYALADALGPDGIRVNAIHPGSVDTSMIADVEISEEFLSQIPIGRVGAPEDVAGVAVFLARDLAGYVTGESVVVDGGYLSSG